jgi:hypothetical protein
MNEKNLKTILIFLISALFSVAYAQSAFASEFSVGIYPPINKVIVDPGSNASIPIYIQNYDKEQVELEIKIKAFTFSSKFDGQAEIVPDSTRLSADYENVISGVKVLDGDKQINSLTLSPLERKGLVIDLEIPKNQPTKDYYVSLIAKSKASSLDQTNVSSIVAGIATNLLISVGKPESPTGIIQDFSTNIFDLKGPIKINLLLENTGKNVFSPKGTVIIKNIYGQVMGAMETVPVNILSHSSRFIPSLNSASKTEIIWNEKNPLGLYQVELSLTLSPEGPLFKRKIYFIAAPIKTLIIILAIIIAIFYLIKKIIFKIRNDNSIN